MGKNKASRNYTNRTYGVHSKTRTYQDSKYGKNFIGQSQKTSRERPSGLIRLTTKKK